MWRSSAATTRSCLRSRRDTISPTSPRSTASGLQMTRVRSMGTGRLLLGVALDVGVEVDHHARLVADHPAAVAVVVLLAAVGAGDGLDRLGPFPAGLERRPPDDGAADLGDLQLPLREL